MSSLSYRQSKIQDKRKKTPWRDFVMEICSRAPFVYTKDRGMVSKYPKSMRISHVIKNQEFADRDNTTIAEYRWSSFFDALQDIASGIAVPHFRHVNAENSDYADIIINSKSNYLSNTVINGCENILYSLSVKDYSHTILNSIMVRNHCTNVFSSRSVIHSSHIFYSQNIHNSHNLRFCDTMIGCSECLYCHNLENASYCISNQKLDQDEYYKKKQELLKNKWSFANHHQQIREKRWENILCADTHGTFNSECQDISQSHYCYNTHHGRNLILHGSTNGSEYAFDCYTGWSPQAAHFYGVFASWNCEHLYCSWGNDEWCNNLYYSMLCDNCSYCLWCIWLKNKQFCILNKQYTKDERYEKVDEIFWQIEKDGSLWAFFPASMNPFYFNDTAAYLIDDSFTKEEVTQAWYLRRDEAIKVDISADAEIVLSTTLDQFESFDSEWNRVISADILKKVIQDESWNYYRIIPMEYKFLMKHGLPLPRQHWLERIKQNFKIQ